MKELYAKYYLDKEYKQKIDEEWNNIEENKRLLYKQVKI